MSLPPSLVHIWGSVASAKSSVAATWPGISWHSFDTGGFERARKPDGVEVPVHEYPAPFKLDMSPKRVALEGWTDLWGEFLTNLINDLKNPGVQTIVIDTASRCWLACHRAYLQQKQEKAVAEGKHMPEGLTQIEFGETNPRMMEVLDAPRSKGKHLVVTSHDEEDRIEVTIKGEKENVVRTDSQGNPVMKPQGFRHLRKNADMELQMIVQGGVPYAIVTKSGLVTLALDGARIANPSYSRIQEVLEQAKMMEDSGLEVPAEW